MKITNYRDIEANEVEEGAMNVTIRQLITTDSGAENFTMRMFEMQPEGSTPLHDHDWEHEVFILEGKGAVVAGGKDNPFREGDAIFVAPKEKHQFKNTGQAVVRFVCLIPRENC